MGWGGGGERILVFRIARSAHVWPFARDIGAFCNAEMEPISQHMELSAMVIWSQSAITWGILQW